MRRVIGYLARLRNDDEEHELVEFLLITGGIALYVAILGLTLYNPQFAAWLQGVLGTG